MTAGRAEGAGGAWGGGGDSSSSITWVDGDGQEGREESARRWWLGIATVSGGATYEPMTEGGRAGGSILAHAGACHAKVRPSLPLTTHVLAVGLCQPPVCAQHPGRRHAALLQAVRDGDDDEDIRLQIRGGMFFGRDCIEQWFTLPSGRVRW